MKHIGCIARRQVEIRGRREIWGSCYWGGGGGRGHLAEDLANIDTDIAGRTPCRESGKVNVILRNQPTDYTTRWGWKKGRWYAGQTCACEDGRVHPRIRVTLHQVYVHETSRAFLKFLFPTVHYCTTVLHPQGSSGNVNITLQSIRGFTCGNVVARAQRRASLQAYR